MVSQFVQVFSRGKTWYVLSGLSRFTCVSESHARALAAQLCLCIAETGRDEGRDD